MKTNLIRVGNSRGVRIPKPFLEEAGLENEIELTIKGGKVIIEPSRAGDRLSANEEALLSEEALSDWLRPEEDNAWKDLQPAK